METRAGGGTGEAYRAARVGAPGRRPLAPYNGRAMQLDAIFKAYDIRGLVPSQLDEATARRIGAAFAAFSGAGRIAVGRDCRLSSPSLAAALIAGISGQGVAVDDLGMITTDMVYYAAGSREEPGAMVTASHNPQGWNGIKLCLAGAAPVGAGTGLEEVRRLTAAPPPPAPSPGEVRRVDVLRRLRGPPALHRRPFPPRRAAGGRRRGQRGGRGGGARRVRPPPGRPSSASTWSPTAASPTTTPTRSGRRTCATSRP